MKKKLRNNLATFGGLFTTIILAGSVIDWDALDWSSVNTYFKVLAILLPAIGGWVSEVKEGPVPPLKTRQDVVGILILIVAACLLAGCVTEKKRLKICKSCTLERTTTDSTTVTVKERTVTVSIPGPTLYVETPNPCAELCDSLGQLKEGFKRDIPGTGGTATIYTRGNALHINCKYDSLRAEIQARDSTIKRLITIQEKEPARCELRHLSAWDMFFIGAGKLWLVLIAVCLIGILIYLWLKR